MLPHPFINYKIHKYYKENKDSKRSIKEIIQLLLQRIKNMLDDATKSGANGVVCCLDKCKTIYFDSFGEYFLAELVDFPDDCNQLEIYLGHKHTIR